MPGHGDQVTLDRLRQLLDQGEGYDLDFKEKCDLNDRIDLLKITKDIAAFAAMGGHLVVGVDEAGSPSPRFDERQAGLFDESILRAKIAPTYLPESVSLTTAVHDLDGAPVVLAYIAPHIDGFVVLARHGDYSEGVGAERVTRFEFREGAVYVRRGSSSVVWSHDEAEAALDRVMQGRRESWRAGLRDDMAALGIGAQAQTLASGSAANFSWRLDNEAFAATLVELLRRDDDIVINLAFDSIARDAADAYGRDDLESLNTIIDRLASAGGVGLSAPRIPLERQAVDGLLRVFDLGYDERGYQRSGPTHPAAVLWLQTVRRVYGLGALGVRKRDWASVRDLALRRSSRDTYYTNWLRETVTEASRAGLFRSRENDRPTELALLPLAAEDVDRLPPLRPDVRSGDPAITASLAQFDLLAILCAISSTGSLDTRSWYTNFARFDRSLSQPALVALLSDTSMRDVIFPEDDEVLAAAIREVDRMATNEGFRFAVWNGWSSPVIGDFLSRHPVTG